ncbi:MAG: imidazoleglycerol-phosphate dehydratase HisB [Candidatus Gracilibacteria bacterium]|jgi:imidazoleglycerol-phosphate dehydratase/histidinol-phosphatase
MKIAFLDRDGVLINEPRDNFRIDSLKKLKILPDVFENLKRFIDEGYKLVMVSNQNGIGRNGFSKKGFYEAHNELLKQLKKEGIEFYKVFICPHMQADKCDCRKPKTGLVKDFLKELGKDFDKMRSFMVGDRETDVEFAKNIGIRGFLKPNNSPFPRIASFERKTSETGIFAQVDLDGRGIAVVDTGIEFFDHMLEQLAKNALIDLFVFARGDLKVDEHHTVEDTGIALGNVILKALGELEGIERYGFVLPMEESLAGVSIDLAKRPYLAFNAEFKREKVGEFPTELVEEFFRALSNNLLAAIHVNLLYGKNDHHKIEAIFKCFGRALRAAIEKNERLKGISVSTK